MLRQGLSIGEIDGWKLEGGLKTINGSLRDIAKTWLPSHGTYACLPIENLEKNGHSGFKQSSLHNLGGHCDTFDGSSEPMFIDLAPDCYLGSVFLRSFFTIYVPLYQELLCTIVTQP